MRRILVFLATMVMGVLVASGVALAAVVSEVEPNDSITGAQPIAAASFDLTENVDIANSTTVPHATVNGGGNAPESIDYYSFTVPAGTPKEVILDIDHTTPDSIDPGYYDSWIELYDSSGTFIDFSDDNSGDPGSTDDDPVGLDSRIEKTGVRPLDPGTYVVGVGKYECVGASCVEHMGVVPNTATYQLHVSVGNVPDTTGPTIQSTTPSSGATKVSRTNPNITATFSEQMGSFPANSFRLEKVRVQGQRVTVLGDPVSTTVVNPADPSTPNVVRLALGTGVTLDKGSYYRVTITTAATDVAGNPLQAGATWRFKTAPK